MSISLLTGAHLTIAGSSFAEYADVKSTTTAGGTFTAGAWQTRTLAEILDPDNIGSISTNVITLKAGTYRCTGWATARNCGAHQVRLYNNTDSSVVLLGADSSASPAADTQTMSVLSGQFSIDTTKDLILQHRCETTKADNGFGDANSFGGDEVYARLIFTSIGSYITQTSIKDEDDMSSDSSTDVASQQSIKAYVDKVSFPNITSVGTLTALQVDNININGNAITSTAGTDLAITPLGGQQIVLDGTIVVDAGVVTGATSITSTAFVGALTGDASGTAATVTGAAQTAITSVGTLTGLALSGTFTLDKGADVASTAGVMTLGADGNYFDITGTNSITGLATLAVGTFVTLHFDAAAVLVHDATNFVLPGGANITCAAGDEFTFVEYASADWRCVSYSLASGLAVGGGNATDEGLYEHSFTIAGAYTITTGNNALSAGPITIGSSGSVTIPATSTWVIA